MWLVTPRVPRSATINFFFSPIFFFDLRDGLRRKGGTARSLTPGK